MRKVVEVNQGSTIKHLMDRKTYTVRLFSSTYVSVLFPPPIGHLGCFATIEKTDAEVGHYIDFLQDETSIALGLITSIELPGSCVRPDMLEFQGWYKIHWVPVNQIENFERRSDVEKCPKCRQKGTLYRTESHYGKRIRCRRCKFCSCQWSTVEVFVGYVPPKGGSPR